MYMISQSYKTKIKNYRKILKRRGANYVTLIITEAVLVEFISLYLSAGIKRVD
jgi:hypothetical protein